MTFRMFHLFALLLALSLAACAAPTASGPEAEATPAPTPVPDDGTAAGHGQVPTLDTSCRVDSDCAVKDVGNCCGTFPACVNVDSPAETLQQVSESAMREVVGRGAT